MALINCEECSKEISSKAQSCPHCGCPVSAQNRTDLKLSHSASGMEINVGYDDAFRLCISAAEKLAARPVPALSTKIDQGIILLETAATHGGWLTPEYRDVVYIKPVKVSSDRTLLSNYHFVNETRPDVAEGIWNDFLVELYRLITPS